MQVTGVKSNAKFPSFSYSSKRIPQTIYFAPSPQKSPSGTISFFGESGANSATSGAADAMHVRRSRRLPVRHCCRIKPQRATCVEDAEIAFGAPFMSATSPPPPREATRTCL